LRDTKPKRQRGIKVIDYLKDKETLDAAILERIMSIEALVIVSEVISKMLGLAKLLFKLLLQELAKLI